MKTLNYKKTLLALCVSSCFSAATYAADQVKSDEEKNKATEVITVSGILGSNLRSVNNKRYSGSIVDGISSEELGKFPDQNVAESLQRITGISIDRSGGEGRFVTVRGFGPEFNSVLYNGRVLATETGGREFSFDVLAAETISGADAYKSGNADLITGGIGATIKLQTAKPMDYVGTRTAFSAKATNDSLADSTFPQFSGVYSFSNENFGALISANYIQRDYRTDGASVGGWMDRDLSYVPNKIGSNDLSNVRLPRNIDYYSDSGTRERIGSNIVLQAAPSDDVVMTFDLLYSKFVVDSTQMTNANWTHDWGQFFDTITVNENNSVVGYSYDDEFNLAADFVQQENSRPTETRQVGFNVDWNVSDDLQLVFDASYSDANNDNRGNDKFVIAGAPNANPRYAYAPGDNYATISYDRGEISADDLRSHQTWFSGNLTEDAIRQFAVDGNYLLDFEFIQKMSFGLYTSDRTKGGGSTNSAEGGEFAGYGYDIPDDLFTSVNQSGFLDGGVPQVWFTFDPYAYAEYLWSTEFLDANFGDDPVRRAQLQVLKDTGNPFPHYDRYSTYSVNEQVVEAYVKFDIDTEIGDMPLSGNFGFRYAQTDVKSTGYDSILTNITQQTSDPTLLELDFTDPQVISISHDYNNFMPSLNLKLDVTDEQVVRFSSSKTLSRPTLSRLGVGVSGHNGRLGASTASGGNPKLNPFESTNFDLSWNWYYDEASYVGITAFVKKADNFLSQTTQKENLLPSSEFGEFLVTRARNTASATVNGYEFALLHTFTNGFGVQANYTLVDSDDDFNAITNPSAFALEGLSNSANLIAFYEQDGIQARLAYNWRDEYLSRAVGEQSQAEMVEAYGQLDMSASYDFSENTTLFFEGTNLTNETTRSFSIFKERLLNYAETGRRLSVGVRVNF